MIDRCLCKHGFIDRSIPNKQFSGIVFRAIWISLLSFIEEPVDVRIQFYPLFWKFSRSSMFWYSIFFLDFHFCSRVIIQIFDYYFSGRSGRTVLKQHI